MAKPVDAPRVQIEPWADTDLDLLRRTNAPEMTEHLGGPETEEQVLYPSGSVMRCNNWRLNLTAAT